MGQAPALHFSLSTPDGSRPSRIRVRGVLSYQSPIPVAAVAPPSIPILVGIVRMGDTGLGGKDEEVIGPLSRAKSVARPMTGARRARRVLGEENETYPGKQ